MAINNAKQQKEQQARVRDFQARNQAHQHRIAKIRRDNILAIIIAVLAVAIVIGVQIWVNQPAEAPEDTGAPTPTTETPQDPLNSGDVPAPELAENRTWSGNILIDEVALDIELYGDLAPQAVSSFVHLAEKGFFDNVSCHRLTNHPTMKVLQCGDPSGNGSGGPEYTFGPIENAPKDDVYPAGSIAMARVGHDANSMGSQFFIVLADSTIPSDSAGGYTLFGAVTDGLDNLVTDLAGQGIEADALDGRPVAPAIIHQLSVE